MVPCRIKLLPGLFVLILSGTVTAQEFPQRTIRIITSEAGGTSDFVARVVAQELSATIGQQAVVDNRGPIAGEIVWKAPPDGHTLLTYSGTFWVRPLLQASPYDPARDFTPIALTNSAPNILVVHPSLPVKSVKELIALAKARSGDLNYGSAEAGSSTHLAGELFNSMAGVKIVRIPYKGSGPAMNAMIGGEVQVMFPSAAGASVHIKSGRLRPLGVTSPQPSALTPGLAPIAASGLPGYESTQMYAVFGPAKMSQATITKLNQEIVRALAKGDVKEKFLKAGVDTLGGPPEQLANAMKSEMTRLGKVIKDAGIKIN